MDTFFESDKGSESVQDDPMLIDFHLGNAINLDIVRALVDKVNPDYDLYIPRFQRVAWDSLSKLIPYSYKTEVGFLTPTCNLLMEPITKWNQLTPKLWKSLASVVIKGLQKKDIQVPIADYEKSIRGLYVSVPEIWSIVFNMSLAAISALSETLRGGTESPYANVIIDGEHVSVNLVPGSDIFLVVGRNMAAIIDHQERTTYVGNYDSVLLLMDTIGQRICSLIGLQIAGPYKISGCMGIPQMMRVIQIGDQILKLNGNLGYEVIAMFEAYVVSIILQKSPDNISNGREFYENCIQESSDLCSEMPYPAETLQLVEEWIMLLSTMAPDHLSNIFCLYRIWGHPAVDIKAGMKKVYDKAMAPKVTMNLSEGLALCQFRHMFLQNYLSKHRQYPDMDIGGTGYVQDCLRRGYPVDHKRSDYCLLDYLCVNINQIWTVPETYDICHILNDKAVSPNRSELHESVSAGKGTVFGTMRRGIIRWMEGDSIRCKEFLNHIDENGLDDDDMIIGMYEKEREIKVKARMFSLMSEKMRMYVVLTEELIANHILPYFPEITMKDPLNVQIRKIWKVGGSGQYENNPNINIDFEKWNLNMRPQFTNGLFRQMDRMFGFSNLILRTHDIFEKSYVYSCSGKYVPPVNSEGFIPDPPMSYIGHKGGFEGLRQKGWTVATVCLLAYTAFQLKIDMQLLGQGDNQVIKLYMPTRRWDNLCYTDEAKRAESKTITEEYIRLMRKNFDDAGLPIKVRETWISTRLFMYGKSMYLDGKCLPQWMKKLLRSYALSNEGSVTISGVIGTIATNMTSAAGASEAPDVMYLIYLFLGEWSLEYLLNYHPFTRKRIVQGSIREFKIPGHGQKLRSEPTSLHRLIASLLLVPTAVGGNVTIPLTGFICRGFPDHASEGYAWLNLLRSVDSPYKRMFDNWYSFLKNDTVQCDMLVQSPWSLNHLKPPTPGLQSREMVREWLLSGRFSKNKFLTNMAAINHSFPRKDICKELMSDPINPLIIYEIFNAFPHSYYDSILRRFEGTRSVRKLAMRESYTKPIVQMLMDVEVRHLDYIIWRAEVRGEEFSPCATQQARMARDIGWERKINGLTTPHPLEYLFDNKCHGFNPTCDGSDYILVRYDPDGAYPPYLGSRVKTKVVSLQDEGARSEPLICANARLARYLKWLNMGENLIDVVRQSTESLCDTNIFDNFYDLTPGAEGYTGCSEHRFNPAAASDGCFINYAPQLGSKVYMSGDYMPQFGKGKDNYTIHFQAVYCFLQYVSSRRSDCTSVHHHLSCNTCIVKCDDTISDISPNHPKIDQAFDDNTSALLRETIGFIKEKPTIHVSQRDYLALDNEIPFDPDVLNPTGCYYGLIYTLATKCALSLLSKAGDTDSMNIEDLQSFPRVYSYKLYVDHIMDAVSNILLYMFIMRQKESVGILGISKAKRGLLRFLDRTPIGKFKEIASLCVGRKSKSGKTRYKIPTGCFPDDVPSFLRGVKNCLLDVLTEVSGFNIHYPKNMYIGKLGITEKEYRVILGMNGVVRHGCLSCGEIMWDDNPIGANSCRAGHMSLILDQIRLTPASLDRMSKLLTIKSQVNFNKEVELQAIQSSMTQRLYRRDVSHHVMMQHKSMRKINLPTASIYKWNAVISRIPSDMYNVVVVLGDGTGGTSMLAAQHFKDSIIFPLAKFERQKMIPQDSDSIHPFLSRGYPNVRYDLLESIPDNIMTTIWVREFRSSLSKIGGSILVISDIEGLDSGGIVKKIREAAEMETVDAIIKVYYDQIREEHIDWLPYVIQTIHANVDYGEEFITSIPWSPSRNEHQSLKVGQALVERSFRNAISLSWALARHKLSSLGISIGKELLLGRPDRLMVALLGHINSRYRFPQDKIRAYDPRNITDGVLKKIIRSVKIIILSLSSEAITTQSWFQNMTLSHATREDRDRHFVTRRINLTYSDCVISAITHEDELVARTIRGHRRSLYEISEFVDLLRLCKPQAQIPYEITDLIVESDSIESVSDISFGE